MVGQKQNIDTIIRWRLNKSIPRFIIIQGEEGSGRLTLAKIIMRQLNAVGIIAGTSVEETRRIINNAYTVSDITCYIFRNCDDMSVQAKNSLLKVVEEPPNKAYFIMTVESLESVLGTIKSRGTIMRMAPYNVKDIRQFTDSDIIARYVGTPGKAKEIKESQVTDVVELADNIIEALEKKSGTSILRYTNNLQNKVTETDKIDPALFLRILTSRLNDLQIILPFDCLLDIENCKIEISRKAVNKKSSVETMLIKILRRLKDADTQ